jgi:HSP20 family protein
MSFIRFKNTAIPSLVGDFFSRENSEIFQPFHGQMIPPVNILENENNFEIHLVAPGLKKENFQINLDENVLTISFKEAVEKEEQKGKFTRKEFKSGSFKRSFTLDQVIDNEQISASYLDGILVLTLPKKEEAKQKVERLIEIQ